MGNTVGELVRNMQDVSELLHNLARGFAPTGANWFQSDNRHVTLQDHRQVHMHDQRQIHNPGSASTDPNPPMAIEQPATSALSAEDAEEVVPSKPKVSRKKVPKSEAGLAQARCVANLIDGFREVRAAHRAHQQNDRRLAIEDQATAAAVSRPEGPPRGRAPHMCAGQQRQGRQDPWIYDKGWATRHDRCQQEREVSK